MFDLQRNSTPANKALWTVGAAAAASVMLISGCGDTEEPAQIEPAQVEPERTSDGPAPEDACERPPDVSGNIPC